MNIQKMVQASLFAALIAICGWISLPIPPLTFTLQTLAVLMALGILGGKWGSVSVLLYLLMGCVGLPVFSQFRGGFGALLDATGGFLWGFFLGALVFRAAQKLGTLPAMVLCQLTVYLCGCLWFSHWAGNAGIVSAALTCVAPYLIPDGIKLALAYRLSRRIGRQLRKQE